MATKPVHGTLPDTPPQSNQPRDAHTPDARTLPLSPPISPVRQQRQQRPAATQTGIDRTRQALVRYSRGLKPSSSDREVLSLSQPELAELERLLQNTQSTELWHLWKEKIRYDYDGSGRKGQLVLRMPSAIHEAFIRLFEDAIESQLKVLADGFSVYDKRAADETRRIQKSGSTTLEYTQPKLEDDLLGDNVTPVIVRHSPDASFKHPDVGWRAPGLVVEISYSQRSEKLARLADSYITNSEHRIKCVVALDVKYASQKQKGSHDDKTATVSVWRPGKRTRPNGSSVGFCKQDIDTVPFRDSKGQPLPGALQLTIVDFLPTKVRKNISDAALQEHISISFETLAEFLYEAERDDHLGMSSEDDKPTFFEKRKRTPSEELCKTDEEEFTELELADLTRAKAADATWRMSSRNKRQAVADSSGVPIPELRRSSRRKNSDTVPES
jgi:hypothetical protein